jgi:hypothetical protein
MATYVNALKEKIAHAPIVPSCSNSALMLQKGEFGIETSKKLILWSPSWS